MRLGWYSRAVLVAWAAYTVLLGGYAGMQTQNLYQQADYAQQAECRVSQVPGYSDSEFCQDPVKLGDTPWATLLNGMMNHAVEGLGYVILAVIAYWAFRWIWAGRAPEATN